MPPLQSLHAADSNQVPPAPSKLGLTMVPLASKIGPPPPVGSKFGKSHGFTQTGAIGPPAPREIVVPDGLYASAAAVALTVTWVRPQIRAKKVGRSFRVTCT